MIYNVSGTSQSRLSARASTERRQCRQFTLAQRRHIVTLVDRAVQEDGVSFNRAADNLQVVPSLFAGGVPLFKFKTPRILKVAMMPRLTIEARRDSWMIFRRNSLPLCLNGEIVECL
jgi:hypothetical protein